MTVLTTATVPCSRQRVTGALRVPLDSRSLYLPICASILRGTGARVLVAAFVQYVSEIVFFVSSAGVITLDHMKKLNEITLVGNTGHFDNEIDFAGSGGSNISRRSVDVLGTGFAGIS